MVRMRAPSGMSSPLQPVSDSRCHRTPRDARGRCPQRGEMRQLFHQVVADLRMRPHHVPLGFVERRRLAEDFRGHVDFADVVQHGAVLQLFDFAVRNPEFVGERNARAWRRASHGRGHPFRAAAASR